jgi:hypothetical protein
LRVATLVIRVREIHRFVNVSTTYTYMKDRGTTHEESSADA